MKDYLTETQGLVTQRDLLRLSMQVTEDTDAIHTVQATMMMQQRHLLEHDDKLVDAFERISETVRRSDISPVFLNFDLPEETQNDFLLLHGHPVRADVTYMELYSRARHSVCIIDNYISIKTLRLLQDVRPGVPVTVFSDNIGNCLHACDLEDFRVEFPTIEISFIRTAHTMHDRFIFLDYGNADERIYHCGASSKDAAVRLTTAITEITSEVLRDSLHETVERMRSNGPLELRR